MADKLICLALSDVIEEVSHDHVFVDFCSSLVFSGISSFYSSVEGFKKLIKSRVNIQAELFLVAFKGEARHVLAHRQYPSILELMALGAMATPNVDAPRPS